MSAGTLTLTNNSAAVTGAGTAFNTEVAAGDFIVVTVGGVPYTLPVKSVEGVTVLTLVSVYTGPTQSGAAWSAVPRVALNMVTAALVAQSAEALRGLNYDKQNWQQVFSQSGDITVKLPDQTEFHGPSWPKITQLLNGIDTDRLEEIAQQVDQDAQQVATDRLDVDTKTAQAAIDAQSAAQSKTEAVAANASAQQAKTATDVNAASAKADADRAQSANPDNQLKKAQNLADLPDKDLSRTNLSVYSKAEVGSKLGYALIDFGSMSIGQRKVLTNPFGNGTPVITLAQVLVNEEWADAGWLYNQSGGVGIGCRAGFTDFGIVVIAGSGGLKGSSTVLTGGIHAYQVAATNPANVRVHVWKLQP